MTFFIKLNIRFDLTIYYRSVLKTYRIGGLFPLIMHYFGIDYISGSFHYAVIVKVT